MMIQDELDDETSLLEEEGMENDEAVQEEVSALEKVAERPKSVQGIRGCLQESEMPLEELLAMYGGAANQNAAIEEQKGAEEEKEKEKEDENVSVRLITENGNDDRGPRRGGWMTSQLLESARGGEVLKQPSFNEDSNSSRFLQAAATWIENRRPTKSMCRLINGERYGRRG